MTLDKSNLKFSSSGLKCLTKGRYNLKLRFLLLKQRKPFFILFISTFRWFLFTHSSCLKCCFSSIYNARNLLKVCAKKMVLVTILDVLLIPTDTKFVRYCKSIVRHHQISFSIAPTEEKNHDSNCSLNKLFYYHKVSLSIVKYLLGIIQYCQVIVRYHSVLSSIC